jgi:hypothetical protein
VFNVEDLLIEVLTIEAQADGVSECDERIWSCVAFFALKETLSMYLRRLDSVHTILELLIKVDASLPDHDHMHLVS